ncbi:MAG: maleylpyruvate isomerase family mycothiol-dependent enzyme [Acidimicrobiales bacterium]
MTGRSDRLDTALGWMDRGSEFFLAQLAELSDEQLAGPSRLPEWSRLHVVSHMAHNARALMNLLEWARTGIETPMYPSPEHRRDDIEAGAKLPAPEVRQDALEAATALSATIEAMPETAWSAPIRTALGRPVDATEVPWMRVREVWVHGVDLGASATFADIDAPVAAALLEEAVARFSGRQDCPAVVLMVEPDQGGRYSIGPASSDALEVHGTTQDLAGWLLGRTAGAGIEGPGPLPDLPVWL